MRRYGRDGSLRIAVEEVRRAHGRDGSLRIAGEGFAELRGGRLASHCRGGVRRAHGRSARFALRWRRFAELTEEERLASHCRGGEGWEAATPQ